MPDIDFRTQMTLWGYAVLGEVTEPDALLVEQPQQPPSTHLWDRTLTDLADDWIDRGRGWEQAPFWFCLRHLPWDWRERAYAVPIDGRITSNEEGGSVEA